jgi:hypothetical protein
MLEAEDAEGLVSLLTADSEHFYVAFVPERGSIEIVPVCTPGKVEASHTVSHTLASQLSEALHRAD